MEKVKIGVIGARRGETMIEYCRKVGNAELVAICEKRDDLIEEQKVKNENAGLSVTYYKDYDEFLNHDFDAVVLANYANEHAPFAIKALNKGKHVFSEVLPCQTMKEAVELIETVEKTGLVYAYGENYCYMAAPYEMKKLYQEGKIGELEYAECEYLHNCESIWPDIAYGDKTHWRNNKYSTYYCTHSIGPIIHATKLRPVSVTGYEPDNARMNARNLRMGAKGGAFGLEMIRLENGAIVKSIHGGLYQSSIWYSMYGSKGRMESERESTGNGVAKRIYVKADENSGDYNAKEETYLPAERNNQDTAGFGHGGSDYYSMFNFIEKIKGKENTDIIDVYEAMDMFLPGMFAYRSILIGGFPVEVPNLRDKAEREKWRNDVACTDPDIAGDQVIPAYHKGNPEISDEVYESQRKKFEDKIKAKQSAHTFVAGKDEYKDKK